MKIYLDTSVIGGYYDDEFQEETQKLFSDFENSVYQPVVSDLTEKELFDGAPQKVIDVFLDLKQWNLIQLTTSEKALDLADQYLLENIVTPNYKDDALHIAIATIEEINVLVSWNFKHIVNFSKIEEFNRVNKSLSYKELEIRSPKEFYYG